MESTKRAQHQPLPFQLSLRIRHPSMDPTAISKELRIEPEYAFRAGQPRASKSSVAPAAVHTESYWLAPLDPWSWFGILPFQQPPGKAIPQDIIDYAVTRNLTGAIGLCAVRLEKSHAPLLHTIRSEGGEISLLVTLSPSAVDTFSLPLQISRTFGELGITLEFEITND
jgi:hypothetical protein